MACSSRSGKGSERTRAWSPPGTLHDRARIAVAMQLIARLEIERHGRRSPLVPDQNYAADQPGSAVGHHQVRTWTIAGRKAKGMGARARVLLDVMPYQERRKRVDKHPLG